MRGAWAAVMLSSVLLGGWGRVATSVHAAGPPGGRTGGFGEPTCQECHAEYGLNEPGGSLTLVGLPAAWEAGQSYALVVILRSEEMGRAGFQLSARLAAGTAAGTLDPVGPRVTVVDSGGVPYAQHAPGGVDPDTPEVARWTVSWQAPAAGGSVVFNAAANSANGDNSPFGDLIYTTEVVVPAASAAPRSDIVLIRPAPPAPRSIAPWRLRSPHDGGPIRPVRGRASRPFPAPSVLHPG